MAYYDGSDDILCPFCGGVFNKDEFYLKDGDIYEVECDNCRKKYTISADISIFYTTQCGAENVDNCDWEICLINEKEKHYEIGGKLCVYAECKRCHETSYVEEDKIRSSEMAGTTI